MKFLRFLSGAAACLLALALPAQDARLSNLAIRAQGGGTDTLITGFTVGPGPNKSVLIRAVGPTLGTFGVGGTLADPKLELYNGAGTKIAENDNWREADAATFAAVGAFPLGAGSRDAALLAELAPGSYTAQVSGVGGAAGVTLVEVYEVSGGATRLVNLSTRAQVGTGGNILIPGITIAPGAGTRRLLLRAVGPTLGAFGVSGVLADPKLELLSGSTKLAENDNWESPIGGGTSNTAQLASAFSSAGAFPLNAGARDAALLINLEPGSYTLQVSGVANSTGAALVEVYDLTPENQTGVKPNAVFYLARLQPVQGTSTASGFATLLIGADGTATVSVTFSNLSSTQSSAHLQIGATSGDFVRNLPAGQVANAVWTFSPSGPFTTNDIITALNAGNLFVSLDTARNPGGELRGNFVPNGGTAAFTAPAAPPALPAAALTTPTSAEAARFLTQATFGATLTEIESLKQQGIAAWLDRQLALPASSHFAGVRADVAAFPNPRPPATVAFYTVRNQNRRAAWWKIVLTADDQLRQRVAFALSEIFVVGDNGTIQSESEGMTRYYDILVNGAFGNFRKLLEDVTLNPIMGQWLSHVMNQKADPVKGTSPDENYAREVQQLFTIGLVQLNPDGTVMLDATGQPIPTYNQDMVSETAKVLTGWAFAVPGTTVFTRTPTDTAAAGAADDSGWLNPMRYYDAFHDKTVKKIVSLQQVAPEKATPTTIPAGQDGPADLKVLLDTLFNHPNTGPFISRQLIQRLVTSNPSPGYVYRVAQVFANDGKGVRGNMAAVVRAILTDYEARSPDVVGNAGYGKVKEPLLRFTAVLRALNARAPNGRFMDSYFGDPRGGTPPYLPTSSLIWTITVAGQGPLDSPTVFNFFSPDYSPPGPLAAAGLVAPELEITDSSFAVSLPNQLIRDFIFRDASVLPLPPSGPSPFLEMDFSPYLPNARNPAALVEQMNLVWCGGQMSPTTRTQLTTTLQSLAATITDLERVQTAMVVVMFSPDGAVQK